MTTEDKERYFHLSKNAHGTMWLMYKPEADGGYKCWEPITEEFWNEFEKLERAQQELQAYRDIIKELIPLAQNFASELRWDEEYSGDKVGGKEAQEIVDRANKLIDTVTPTSKP